MYQVHPTSTTKPIISLSPPTRHGRKASHVQFGKRSYSSVIDDFTSSGFSLFPENNPSPLQEEKAIITTTPPPPPPQRLIQWLFTKNNIGPFKTNNHWPFFTGFMVAFSVIVFSAQLILSKQSGGEFLELEPFNYMLGPSLEIMIQSGARFPPCMRIIDTMSPNQNYVCLKSNTPTALLDPVSQKTNTTCTLSDICGMTSFYQANIPDQTYRFLTPLFVHTGMIHLAINMLVLILFGIRIEKSINSLRFSILYICSGVFGHALGSILALVTTPFLGCSSSLFGLMGFLFIDLWVSWKTLHQPIKYLCKLVLTTAFMLILGVLPGVDTFSHVGGFIAGILLGLFLVPVQWWTKSSIDKKRLIFSYSVRILSLFFFALFLGLLVRFFTTVSSLDQVCPFCRYIACLPVNGFCQL